MATVILKMTAIQRKLEDVNWNRMTDQQKFSEHCENWSQKISSLGLNVIRKDLNRPWGGFWVLSEDDVDRIIDKFFSNAPEKLITKERKLSPKILLISPHSRLSWQYHERRAELWSVLEGQVGIVRSNDDEEGPTTKGRIGDFFYIEEGERHRLVGLEAYAVIAELWQHTTQIESNEADIIRLQDDFERT